MMKNVVHTCATTTDGSTMLAVIQLGFVPDKVTIVNRTTCVSIVWYKSTPAYVYLIGADGAVSRTNSYTLTAVDGSDKVTTYPSGPTGYQSLMNYSYGFILPVITDVNDTGSEVLDITAERSDI
jgi:hypothetical protein